MFGRNLFSFTLTMFPTFCVPLQPMCPIAAPHQLSSRIFFFSLGRIDNIRLNEQLERIFIALKSRLSKNKCQTLKLHLAAAEYPLIYQPWDLHRQNMRKSIPFEMDTACGTNDNPDATQTEGTHVANNTRWWYTRSFVLGYHSLERHGDILAVTRNQSAYTLAFVGACSGQNSLGDIGLVSFCCLD